jgi:hypothetical protein
VISLNTLIHSTNVALLSPRENLSISASVEANKTRDEVHSRIAMKALGWRYYIVFCCLLAILFGIVWFSLRETKGRTLEEIAEVFDGKEHGPSEEGLVA